MKEKSLEELIREAHRIIGNRPEKHEIAILLTKAFEAGYKKGKKVPYDPIA